VCVLVHNREGMVKLEGNDINHDRVYQEIEPLLLVLSSIYVKDLFDILFFRYYML